MSNMLGLLKTIDRRFTVLEREITRLYRDVETFERELTKVPAAEQLQYAELARSAQNRIGRIKDLLLK